MSPPRELYSSLDEMLSLEALSQLEGRTVTSVRREPFTTPYGGVSGNTFLAIETAGSDGQQHSYIVKRTAPAWDIIMRITGDTACREMLIWQYWLLDRLPPEVEDTIVACAAESGVLKSLSDTTPRMEPAGCCAALPTLKESTAPRTIQHSDLQCSLVKTPTRLTARVGLFTFLRSHPCAANCVRQV